MTKRHLSRADVDARIDILDVAERRNDSAWRKPMLDLLEDLRAKQRVRRWLQLFLLCVSAAAPALLGPRPWWDWVLYAGGAFTIGVFLLQITLERWSPTLDREARIEALWGFYLAWTDQTELASDIAAYRANADTVNVSTNAGPLQ